jgi:hypothetical protein
MSRRTATRAVAVALAGTLAGAMLLRPSPAAGQPGADQALGEAVAAFLRLWLEQGRTDAAVSQFVSTKVRDRRLAPAQSYPREQYAREIEVRAAVPQPMSSDEFAARLGRVLTEAREELQVPPGAQLKDLLVPVTVQTDGEVWERLARRGLAPQPLVGVQAVGYPIKSWDDLAWTASSTVGHWELNPDLLGGLGIEHRAVAFRVQVPRLNRSAMICTLWAREGSAASWRLWAFVPVPTE